MRAHVHHRHWLLLQVEEAGVWDEWVESAFNEIDTDASGSLDSTELRECGPPQRMCQPLPECVLQPCSCSRAHMSLTPRLVRCARRFLCKDGSCLTPQAVEDAVRGLTASSEGMDIAAFKQLLSARAAHDDLHVFAHRGS